MKPRFAFVELTCSSLQFAIMPWVTARIKGSLAEIVASFYVLSSSSSQIQADLPKHGKLDREVAC